MQEIVSIHFDSIDSTNSYAKKHGLSFDPKKITCIDADEQTAGRGRFQRKWDSPEGVNLYVTFYFHLRSDTLHLISLAQVMAASFASVLLKENLSPKIKWPNDLLLDGKKISGILCETLFHPSFVEVILGIGINVNMEDFSHIDQPAASLKTVTGHLWDRRKLLRQLQIQFAHDLDLFKKEGFTPFHSLFENLLAFKGEQIRCFDGKKTWEGMCHSITADGQLNLYLSDQSIHTITSGDLF